MLVKTLLNRCHPIKGFVYDTDRLVPSPDGAQGTYELQVVVRPRGGNRACCGKCGRTGSTYDTSRKPRRFAFIPLWGFAVALLYCMRRVKCEVCGVTTEQVPWADGKNQTCNVYRAFLARWAKRLSWEEVARVFGVGWGVVYRSVQWVVAYGLAHRSLDGVESIGIDEVAVWKGHKYLTVVYDIGKGGARLLWVAKDRTEDSLRGFFDALGKKRSDAIKYVASDMWQPYLTVIAERTKQALNVLDRFHVAKLLNKAVDEVRRRESKQMAADGYVPILKRTRWCFLKRPTNLTSNQAAKLADVLQYNLRTVRAYLLKEAFDALWQYTSPWWAGWFLDRWCTRAMRSRLEPMKTFVGTLRTHRELLLNWFRAKKQISNGIAEAMNCNVKLALRKARGFRSLKALEVALYHQLGNLPEPVAIHRFC